jgi:WD40 repeat protein
MDLLFSLRGHLAPVTAISLRNQLVSGDDSGNIFVWNLDLRRVKFRFQSGSAPVLNLYQTDAAIIVQSRDNFIRIYDFEGKQLDEIPCESLHFCKFVYSNNLLFFCNPYKPGIVVYDIPSKAVTNIAPLIENLGACTALAIDQSSNDSLWVGYEDGSCVLTNLNDQSTIISPQKHSEPIMGLDSNIDYCISCGADDKVLYHASTQMVNTAIQLDNPGSSFVKFCGSKVIVCGWNSKLYLYEKIKLVSSKMEHRKQCRCADHHLINIKGKEVDVVAVGSEDTLISVWKIL